MDKQSVITEDILKKFNEINGVEVREETEGIDDLESCPDDNNPEE